MEIDIYFDPVCPWCFIGKRRLERALAQRPEQNPTVRWRTFQLNPEMPQEGMERSHYLTMKFGGGKRARYLYENIRKVGTSVGIEFAFEGRPIDNTDALIQIAVEAGLNENDATTYLLGDENLMEVRQEDSAARRLGIQGVPCFIINKQFSLSGAQEPEAFFPIFEIASQEVSEATT